MRGQVVQVERQRVACGGRPEADDASKERCVGGEVDGLLQTYHETGEGNVLAIAGQVAVVG